MVVTGLKLGVTHFHLDMTSREQHINKNKQEDMLTLIAK